MGNPERACVAAEARQALQQLRVGRACEQRRNERVFLCPREIDLVDLGHLLAIEVGAQPHPRDTGRRLDRQHAFRGNLVPVGYGRLRNANPAGELGNPADRLYGFTQTRIAHQSLWLWVPPRTT
jgi:hypothetical protein